MTKVMRAIALTALLMGLAAAGPATQSVDALINQLGADSAAARDQAQQQLAALGQAARPALLKACADSSPEVRVRAQSLLARLPWWRSDDPPEVKEVLRAYGEAAAAERGEHLAKLAALEPRVCRPALIRIMRQEPNLDLAWTAAFNVAELADDRALADWRTSNLEADERAPSVWLAGKAWIGTDRKKGLALFRLTLALQTEHPSRDGGALKEVFTTLLAESRKNKEWENQADLLRLQAWGQITGSTDSDLPDLNLPPLAGDDGPVPRAVQNLFALHATHGPLSLFERDLLTFASYLNQPPILYCLGKTYQRTGQRLLAAACFRAAFAAGGGSQVDRCNTGLFLVRQGWFDLAERELDAVLLLDGPDKAKYDVKAHVQLSFIGQWAGEDFATAEHLRLTMELLPQADLSYSEETQHGMWVEIHWRYFRAARAKQDEAGALKEANETLRLDPTDPAVALDLVPWLAERGRRDDAAHLAAATLAAHADDDALRARLSPFQPRQ